MLCENELFLRILYFFNIAISVIRFVIPIILIVKMALDIYHQVINVDDKDSKDKITKRIVASIIIFLVPTIINVFLGFMETISGYKFNYSECNANANPQTINDIISKREEEENKKNDLESEENKQKIRGYLSSLTILTINNNSTSKDHISPYVGQKFDVSDSELNDIAKVCQREQGSPEGSAIEAELMINKYILSGYEGSLYDYIFKSTAQGWWSPIKHNTYKATILKPANREAVRKVVVEGIRKWPGYINEHDCFNCGKSTCAGHKGDICYLTLNGQQIDDIEKIKTRSDSYYVRDKTRIQNVMGGNYTFYGFVQENGVNVGDPFGYTDKAKSQYDSMNK